MPRPKKTDNNMKSYSMYASEEFLEALRKEAELQKTSVTDVVISSVMNTIKVNNIKRKLNSLGEEPVHTKYMLVSYNSMNYGAITVYETEQAAIDDSIMRWNRLTKQAKEDAMLFSVVEIKATNSQCIAIQNNELDPTDFISRTIKSYI